MANRRLCLGQQNVIVQMYFEDGLRRVHLAHVISGTHAGAARPPPPGGPGPVERAILRTTKRVSRHPPFPRPARLPGEFAGPDLRRQSIPGLLADALLQGCTT